VLLWTVGRCKRPFWFPNSSGRFTVGYGPTSTTAVEAATSWFVPNTVVDGSTGDGGVMLGSGGTGWVGTGRVEAGTGTVGTGASGAETVGAGTVVVAGTGEPTVGVAVLVEVVA
jgi:hypothetical protein